MAGLIPKIIPVVFREAMLNQAEALTHGSGITLPRTGLIWYAKAPGMTDSIGESTVIKSRYPSNAHPTMQQVKGSGFTGAGSATVTGILTTDTITATCAAGSAPTCGSNGTLTFGANTNCWDVYVHRAGVLWGYFPGINVGQVVELDASGNGHHLTALTTTTITERLDGTGTDYCNVSGFSERENLLSTSQSPSLWLQNNSGGGALDGNVVTLGGNDFVAMNVTWESDTNYLIQATLQSDVGTNVQLNPVIKEGESYIEPRFNCWIDGDVCYTQFATGTVDPAFGQIRIYAAPLQDITTFTIIELSLWREKKSEEDRKLVLLGDSLTAAATSGYGTQLPTILPLATIVNAGVAGNTLADMDSRFAADVVAQNPDVCILLGGANDIGTSRTLEQMMASVQSIHEKSVTAGIDLICCGMPAANWTDANLTLHQSYNAWLSSYCSINGLIFVDFFTPTKIPTGTTLQNHLSSDGLHMDPIGYQLLSSIVANYLDTGLPNIVTTTGYAIAGRQPAGFQSITDYVGPLRDDLIVTVGTEYPDVTVTAPLGPKFQAITEWTNNAAVDLATFIDTDKSRFGTKGGVIYTTDQDAAAKARIDRVIGNT